MGVACAIVGAIYSCNRSMPPTPFKLSLLLGLPVAPFHFRLATSAPDQTAFCADYNSVHEMAIISGNEALFVADNSLFICSASASELSQVSVSLSRNTVNYRSCIEYRGSASLRSLQSMTGMIPIGE